jgi:hypothetical protein
VIAAEDGERIELDTAKVLEEGTNSGFPFFV